MNKIALRFGINHHWNHLYYQNLAYVDPRYPLPLYFYIKQDQHILRVLKGFYPLSKIEIHKTRERMDIYICRDNYVNYPLISFADTRATGVGPRILSFVKILLAGRGLYGIPLNSNMHDKLSEPRWGLTDPKGPAGKMSVSKNNGVHLKAPSLDKKVLSYLKMHRSLFNILKTRIQLFNLYTFPIHEAELLVGYLLKEEIQKGSGSTSIKNKARLNAFKRLWNMGIIKGVKIKIQGRYKKSTRTQNEVYQFGQIPNTPTTNLRIKLFYASRVLLQSLGTSSLHIYIVYAPRPKVAGLGSGKLR